MGAGASKPPIPATHPAGVAFRRKLEEIRRRRKVRAFRDSIVSTTELLKDRTDLESVGDVARLSAVGFETDSAEPAKDAPGAAKDDKPSGDKMDAVQEDAALDSTAIASKPAGNVVAAEVKAETKEAAEIDEKKEVAEVVVTKKVEIAEAVTSLAAEVALLKIEEDGEEEVEEEEKDGSELAAGDLPGSPSFRYFAMINNQAGDSDDSDENQEAGHGKDDDEEDGN